MAATISPARWLRFVRGEYLELFIKQGGTSIKFVVPVQEQLRGEIDAGVVESAENAGYIVARVSAADTRIHMIDQLFFRIAEQIPWRELSERVNLKLAAEKGYIVPPEDGPESLVDRLADSNMIESPFLMMEARRWIAEGVLRQTLLAKEFRIAATHLCLAEMSGGPDGETKFEVIANWLCGRNRAVSAVKPYQIFSRVSRSNARHLLVSLLHWIRFAGFPGLVITLDISRVTLPRNPKDGLLFYTKAQMLDAYEVLRQFIDATDRMKGCLMVVEPAEEFLDLDPLTSKGLGAYNALRLRVYDDVHDQRLANPMAALVRVSGQEQGA